MKLRQENCKAEDSLECMVRFCLRKKGRERRGGGEGRGKGTGEEGKRRKGKRSQANNQRLDIKEEEN